MVDLLLDNTATTEFTAIGSVGSVRIFVIGDGSATLLRVAERRSNELEGMALPFQTLQRIAQDNPAPDEWLMGDEECPF